MSQTPACPDVPDTKEAAVRVAEIRRLLVIFDRGCTNSEIVNGEPEACEECTAQIFGFIQNVVEGRAYDADRASRALTSTALAARPEEGWKIKPLEWVSNGPWCWRAPAPLFGSIRVENFCEGWIVSWSVPGFTDEFAAGKWQSGEEAKAAAQTEYETRIRSALVAPSTPPTAGDGHD